MAEFTEIATGGAETSGLSTINYLAFISLTGGINAGSSAESVRVVPVDITGAGVVCSGTVPFEFFAGVVIEGGAVVSGEAIKESPVYHYPNLPDVPIAPIQIGGEPVFAVSYITTTSGGITIGSETTFRVHRKYISDGMSDDAPPDFSGVTVGYLNELNPTTTKLVANIDFDFSWRIAAYVIRDYDFLWNVGRIREYWYRVVGRGKDEQCDPIQTNDPCCYKFVMNVQARSVEDLCRKLKERRFKWPIASVERFSRPAETSAVAEDEALGINHDCNKLEPVQICGNPVCADFCVQYDLIERWGIGTSSQVNAFKEFEGSGEASTGGMASTRFLRNGVDLSYMVSGGVDLSGVSTAVSSGYTYSGVDGVVLSGSASLSSSNWKYTGGVWPYVNDHLFGTETDQFAILANDQAWQLPDRVLTDSAFTSNVDLSFGRKSQFLIVRGFNLALPSDVRVVGFKAIISRYANSNVKDSEVYLVLGNTIISDNMADNSTTWPIGIAASKEYGGVFDQWRDDSDPDFLGEWDVDDVDDPEFGIAIRVFPDLNGAGISASINYVNLLVYTEKEDDTQTIRINSSASVVSSNYVYTASGSVSIGGDGIPFKVSRIVTNTGRGSLGPEFAGIRITGQYGLNLHYISDGLEVSFEGESGITSTVWHTSGSGEVETGGEAGVISTNYTAFGTGAIEVTSNSLIRTKYRYLPLGDFQVSGASDTLQVYEFTATGGIVLDGNPSISSSAFKWVSDGNAVFVGGTADLVYSDLGTLLVGMGITTIVDEVLLIFPEDDDTDTLVEPDTTVTRCNCNGMPLSIPFSHNMFASNKLTQFLNRNNLSIDRVLNLYYNEPNDSWQANLHLKGRSAQSNTLESWDIVFDLQCTDIVDGDEIGQNVWRFGVHFLQKNLATLEDYDTRLLVSFVPDRLCLNGDFQAAITMDTSQNLVSITPTSTVYQQLLYDNIGLFKNDFWTLNPDIFIQIAQFGVPEPIPRYTINIGV